MSFLNKSVNYSQTNSLKEILKPLLQNYNEFVISKKKETSLDKDVNTGISYDYLIPNNNKKYYVFITRKNLVDNQKTNYEILYFFPDQYNTNSDKLETFSLFDFCLEIDCVFEDDILFEGYLYKKDDRYEYLLTDILMKSKNIIDVSYELRYVMLNEMIKNIGKEKLECLNNHMKINIHPIFDIENEKLIKIFKNNFIHKNEIDCIEKICYFTKRRFINVKSVDENMKTIQMGKYIDVYNVYNANTNNMEGILYIKGIGESKKMKRLFENETAISLKCKWNQHFSKWEPILV